MSASNFLTKSEFLVFFYWWTFDVAQGPNVAKLSFLLIVDPSGVLFYAILRVASL